MLRMTGPLLPFGWKITKILRKVPSGSSTGLGLAIVKAIAEAHGGTASVTSPGKSVGATFTVTLPWLV